MASSDFLNNLEKIRLKDLNDRTVCISPNKHDRLPNTDSLRDMGFSHQSMVWMGRSRRIFIIFEDLGKLTSFHNIEM